MRSFAGARIVLTGVSSGIGAASAQMLKDCGAYVIGIDRSLPSTVCDEFHRCDLSQPDEIDDLADRIAGTIEGLVNVAGVSGSQTVELIAKVNFLAVRRLTERLLPRLSNNASVVNVASAAGSGWRNRLEDIKRILMLTDWQEALNAIVKMKLSSSETYDFSKELVVVYSALICSAEWHRGVRVNSLSPGAVDTPILAEFQASMGDEFLAMLRRQAGGRDAVPAEIAGPILFLLGSDARWINGTDLLVDGGAEIALSLAGMAKLPIPGRDAECAAKDT